MPSLFVTQGVDQGQRFELDLHQLTLGRDPGNPIQLHDREVSRQHAEIRWEDGRFLLQDLASANGTFLNGQRITRQPLTSGDQVQIGRTLMLFTGPGGDSDHDLAEKISILERDDPGNRSRIVRTMSQAEGSRILDPVRETAESPWLARARSNLQVMYRTALAVSQTLDIDQLLARIMHLIFEWVAADRGCIMLIDPQTGLLEPKVRHHRQGLRSTETISISQSILDYVLQNKEGVLSSDAKDDARWDPGASIVRQQVREAICVPLQARYHVVGVIYIDTAIPPDLPAGQSAPNQFSAEHLQLMVAIGHQAALAVEDTRYYSAMVQAERLAAMGQTIAVLSHHIKNILQGIRGGSYLIEMGLAQHDEDVVRKGWKIVEKRQNEISNLVLDMLTFGKEREPELVADDLNRVAGDVAELMHSRAAECGVDLAWRPAESMPPMTFDPEGLHRAVLNVVTNAIDACQDRPQGRVALSTEYLAQPALLRVIVEDNGCGIAPEDQEKVFSLFVSKKGARGTGLGLPVSNKIIKEHGGKILIESQLGQGSRFILEIPAIPPASGSEIRTNLATSSGPRPA